MKSKHNLAVLISAALFNIIPIDDISYLAIYEHYPEGRTEAFCLTRMD